MNMVERVSAAILAKVPMGYGMTREEASEYARERHGGLGPYREPAG